MRLPLVIGGIPIIPIDFSEPPVTVAMRALSLLGTIPLVTLAALSLALVLFWRRRWTSLNLLALTVGGGELIGLLLKWPFAQPRPSWPDPLVVFTSSSFPSGHAMRSVLFFGLLSYFLLPRIGSWRGRVGILLGGGALVLMIGVSRVYLEAHTLSDVLAGYAAGMVWLGCAMIGITKIKRTGQNHIDTRVEENTLFRGPLTRHRGLHKESQP
jgi:membrane-associated phospholipid phosphatase